MLLSVFVLLGILLIPSDSISTEEYLGSPLLQQCFEEAKKIVDDAYKYSRGESLKRVRRDVVSHRDALHLLKQPRADTRYAVRSADYMTQTLRLLHERIHRIHKRSLNATDLLSKEDLNKLSEITGCKARVRQPSCSSIPYIDKYRTATSVCNNLNNPRLGASNTPFARWVPAQYDDGFSEPKGYRNQKINNFFLPLVRQVSNNILATGDFGVSNDTEYSYFLTFFGQWNDHDLTFTPFSPSIKSFSNGINCDESCERTEPCIPIKFPVDDPRHTGPHGCLPTFRSAPACGTGFSAYNFGGKPTVREQINGLTAFLDMGQVYGSEEKLALNLRNLTTDEGLMRVNTEFTDRGRELLPFSGLDVNMCATHKRTKNNSNAREVPCFLGGDVRVDENIALTTLHVVFLREHNRLARQLKRINPHWDGEILYQEARKIMGAYAQIFAFRDFLPIVVGEDAMNKYLGPYPGYDPNVDPSIANVFGAAAFRFGHLAIQPFLHRLEPDYKQSTQYARFPLFKGFMAPWLIIYEGGIDYLLRGLIGRPAKLNTQDHMMVDALRDRLFEFVQHIALDLGSLNMQRGRDHGLPGYNAYRKLCGLSQPKTEAQLTEVLQNSELAKKLLAHYGTPDNIDTWLGGLSEPFVTGGRVGPLFTCLIARQFRNIRQGDRLWYERTNVFTAAQRTALKSANLAKIICENSGITAVPPNVLFLSTSGNRFVNCRNIRSVDLSAWRENPCKGFSCDVKTQNQQNLLATNSLHDISNQG